MGRPIIGIRHPHVLEADDGRPMVFGSNVPVHRLFAWHRQGTSVETLIKRYPRLGIAAVLDALAFAYDNPNVMAYELEAERQQLKE